jgi:TonB-linked SusC/RagA family outer membrane protein
MKHIKEGFILCAMLASFPNFMKAQTPAANDTDSLNAVNNRVVKVAFREVASDDLLGGVSVMNYEELLKKNYNTYTYDNLEGYVGGFNGASMWGQSDMLVLVDGVPRDANNVLPSEIADITFLKGASAVVLYGSRGANGVVCITTKRGKIEPLKIDVRANTGYHVAKSYPKYLGSAEYMSLYNEALTNDGLTPLYSDEEIYNHASGSNPYRYADVDFYSSDYIKSTYNRTDVTTEISGGNERSRFYSNVGYSRQGSMMDFGEAADDNTQRLNIRGNMDVQLNKYISAFINANTTFYDARRARTTDPDGLDYWGSAATMRPNRLVPLVPVASIDPNDLASLSAIENSSNIIGGKYFLGGTQVDNRNIFADYYAAGSNKWTSRQFQFDTGLEIDLNNVLEGLSFQTQFAVDYSTSYNTSYINEYAIYDPSWFNYNGEDVAVDLVKYGNDKKSGVQNISGSSNRQIIAYNGQFNYKNTFNADHHVTAILLANVYKQNQSEVYHATSNANLGLHLGYDFQSKYFAEFGGALVHSSKLAEGHRGAFSPSLTLGWRLSKENFLSESSVVDDLMVSVSGSELNTDRGISDHYMYEANYTQGDGAWWGWYDGASERSTIPLRGSNYDLTFVKRKELSANIRTSLFKRLLTADVSFFVNSTEGQIIEPNTLFPNYFWTYYPEASFVPYVNYNNDKRSGFDFSVNFNKRVGQVDLTVGVVGTYYNTKVTRAEENEFANLNREGKAVDGIWGLKSDGFYKDQNEINAGPESSFEGKLNLKPGDIKYVDQNNDDMIDEKDYVFLEKGGWYGTPFTSGINLTAKWKNLSFFALGTGYFGGYAVKNNSYHWVYGSGKYSEVVRDRWTPETAETATYPRLTTKSGSHNFRTSDFWLYKTDHFNLAKVQVTYDLPSDLLKDFFIHGVSAYVSGSNLLTISKEREILEMNVGSAPQTRFYNVGVKATF